MPSTGTDTVTISSPITNFCYHGWVGWIGTLTDLPPPPHGWREISLDAGIIGTIFVDRPRRRVFARYSGYPSAETLDHCLNDLILPRLVASDGELVLHGSLVSTDSGLVGFIGPSGQGKSTLAASLVARGAGLLTDDAFLLQASNEDWRAKPIAASLRLFPDAIEQIFPEVDQTTPVAEYTSKRRVPISTKPDGGPIAALFRLAEDANDVRVDRLPLAEACIALVSNAFALEPQDAREASRRFANAAELSKAVPVFNLDYPRDFGRLAEVHTAILETIGQHASGTELP